MPALASAEATVIGGRRRGGGHSPHAKRVNEHENKTLIRRGLEAADGGFPADSGSFFAPPYRGHLSGRIHMDLEELVRLERGFAAAFADVKRAIDGSLWRQLTAPTAN